MKRILGLVLALILCLSVLGGAVAEENNFKIGYCCMNMTNTYHATAAKYFELECQKRGIEYIMLDDEQDATKAIENCQLCINSDCDVYVSVCGYLVGDALADMCHEAGIIAIGMDQPIGDFPFFGANNVQAGNIAGDALADAAIARWGENAKIDLYIGLEYLGGAQVNSERMIDGLLAGLRGKLDIPDEIYVQCDVLDNSAENAMRYVEDTIAAHPDAEHILIGGFVDDFGQGAEAAIEKLGIQDKALISTVDGSTLFLNNCKNEGTSWVCAAAMTPEMYGYYMVDMLCKYFNGEIAELPSAWYVQHAAITVDNYKEVLTGLIDYDEYKID